MKFKSNKRKGDDQELVVLGSGTNMTVEKKIRSIMTWNVKIPPVKKIKVHHTLVPSPLSALQLVVKKERRLSLEIVGPANTAKSSGSDYYKLLERTELANDEFVHVKLSKKNSSHAGDDTGVTGISTPFSDEVDEDAWEEIFDCKLEDVVIQKTQGHVCEIKVGGGHATVVTDLLFEAGSACKSFNEAYALLKRLQEERSERQVEAYKQIKIQRHIKASKKSKKSSEASETLDRGVDMTGDEIMVNLLVEIVSAVDLPTSDLFWSDAYVVVYMDDKKVHRTGIIPKCLDPIWTLNTGSLFLLSMTPEEFFSASGGMKFIIKDHDALKRDDVLGRVHVSLGDLLDGTGERVEYEIDTVIDNEKNNKSKLYLRFKEATKDDFDFMEVHSKNSKAVGVYSDETFLPLNSPEMKWLKRQNKIDKEAKNLMHRIKPYPDPSRDKEDTQFMSSQMIHEDALKHSTRWTEAGSGKQGKIYFEIIGCDHLPNLDVAGKTDAFCCLVFEDTIVNTDVIGSSLSPRWPSWSRRSFIFNVSHPESDLFLGVFDYDPELSPIQMASRATSELHDPIGRLQIKLSNFNHSTIYTLKYNLFSGESAEDRKKANGTITVRLRIEWRNTLKAFLSCCIPPAQQYVSVATKSDFEVAHFVTEGRHDEKGFSMTTFTEYIEELQSYQMLKDPILDAFFSMWLWRGHYPLKVGGGKTIFLPLHSMTAFLWAVLVSRDFNCFPSFCVFVVAWIMLASNEYWRQSPSPWHRSRSYFAMAGGFGQTIEPNQNKLEIIEYERTQKKKRQEKERQRAEEEKHDRALRKELGDEIEEAGAEDEDITTKKGGPITKGIAKLSVNPLKPVLYPIQKRLHKAVIGLRAAGSIIRWDEPFYAYWIVTFAFMLCFVFFWIPWGFIFRWLLRIVAWGLFGPWMAIVDRIYFREKPNLTQEQKDEEIKKKLDAKYEKILKASTDYQVRKERACKLKEMKKYMFGDFLLRVPRFSEDMFVDTPLPESSAYPYDASTAEVVVVTDRIFGQQLKGDMIPRRDKQVPEIRSEKNVVFDMNMVDNINNKMNVMDNVNEADEVINRGVNEEPGMFKSLFSKKGNKGGEDKSTSLKVGLFSKKTHEEGGKSKTTLHQRLFSNKEENAGEDSTSASQSDKKTN